MSLKVSIEKALPSFKLNVDFNHKKGVLGFLGESGSGKSICLKCIAGIEKPSKGNIILNNSEYYNSTNNINMSPQKRKVGFLFQNYALFPNMSVIENIKIGLTSLKKQEKSLLAKEYIDRFGLSHLQNHYPWELSGGQQQRVALARALVTSPDLLLLDEPFSALDYHLRYTMEKELIEILKQYNGDVIFVTHDIEEAYRVCDNIIIFDNGVALNSRSKNDLFLYPKSFAEAKLTGCKNLSEIKLTNNNKILAKDFGYEYLVNFQTNHSVKYMGIRAHDIELCTNIEEENAHPYFVENIVENPFNYVVYIKNINTKNLQTIDFYINKNNLHFNVGDVIIVKFPKDKIFLF